MILVVVGQTRGFTRLVKKIDEIAGRIDERVIIQLGHTRYYPKNSEFFYFENYSKMKELNREARIVVSHAGVGSILTAIKQGTTIIIMPRLKKYGEAIDDHQLEISEALSGDPRILIAHDENELEQYLKLDLKKEVTEKDRFPEDKGENRLVNSLRNCLASLD
jgi:beta-1,4-N-acetylglucosaminyltransferase